MTCPHALVAEPIYLKTGVSTRKLIGEVAFCYQCKKVRGDAKKTDALKESEWQLMVRVRPEPPFYFEQRNGSLVPEGHKVEDFPVAQDFAAGDEE